MADKKVKVAVFDLNGTLYHKKSKDEFYKFIVAKKPFKLGDIFQMAYFQLLNKLNRINQTEFKENFFSYLDNIPPKQVEAYAQEFWEREFPQHFNKKLLKHLDELKEKGVQIYCLTGGLELYVKPLFKLYKIDGMMGTQVEYKNNTYKVEGKACKDEEKLKRLDKHFKGKPYRIVEAYSDSKEAILKKADKSWLVKKGEMVPFTK